MNDLWDRWTRAIADELPAAVELRHAVHADPRGSGDEEDTARLVTAALGAGDGTRVAKTGRAIRLPGPADGPAVALRAELDALPVLEGTNVPWASESDVMHACGHDVHLAALVAVGRAASAWGVPRPILALLQPREETSPPGALDVVESGVLAESGVDTVIGAHVQPRIAHGVGVGVTRAGERVHDEFEVTLHGQGGHAGYPACCATRSWRCRRWW